jgi:hypothetical protein
MKSNKVIRSEYILENFATKVSVKNKVEIEISQFHYTTSNLNFL